MIPISSNCEDMFISGDVQSGSPVICHISGVDNRKNILHDQCFYCVASGLFPPTWFGATRESLEKEVYELGVEHGAVGIQRVFFTDKDPGPEHIQFTRVQDVLFQELEVKYNEGYSSTCKPTKACICRP